ncbi:MAG: hypothetical protein QM396_06225 [Euryarchaeota archaeon]|jgi:hypothetical protein|uniref:hypothetical protein n=1 Tax=Methanobacterium sp. MZD130B TaxID=3394378 RepID=UPI00176E7025|nr:hypothetical protein [Euryarchaeota archaeon]HHT17958.1 hypothetical protein [Methanobacterium sp.]
MVFNGKKSSKLAAREGGFLFCSHCGGHYKLKKGESQRDYSKCECNNPLEFCKTKKILDQKIHSRNQKKEAFNHFENRISERRENLKDIFPKVVIDDDFITDRQVETDLWDFLDNRFEKKGSQTGNESELTSQKKYLDIILEEERLMTIINQKKTRMKNESAMDQIVNIYNNSDPTRLLGIIIIILIIILFAVVITQFMS